MIAQAYWLIAVPCPGNRRLCEPFTGDYVKTVQGTRKLTVIRWRKQR
jgi:hypothetical protein